MFYDGSMTDCAINWQLYQNELRKNEKREEKEKKKVDVPEYDVKDPGFMQMVKALALSTTSIFAYTPDAADVKGRVGKETKYKADGPEMKELKPGSEAEKVFNHWKQVMIDEENAKNYIKR